MRARIGGESPRIVGQRSLAILDQRGRTRQLVGFVLAEGARRGSRITDFQRPRRSTNGTASTAEGW